MWRQRARDTCWRQVIRSNSEEDEHWGLLFWEDFPDFCMLADWYEEEPDGHGRFAG